MAIPPRFIEELRSRLSIVSVVGRRVKLTRKGNKFWGTCPFHNEKTASFSVSDDKGYFHCFGCGAHGDVIKFEMDAGGLSFPEAVEKLAHEAGMEVPAVSEKEREREQKRASVYDVLETACCFFQESLYASRGREALAYFRKRGLSDEIIKRFRLGFAPAGNALKAFLATKDIPEETVKASGILTFPTDGRSSYDYFRDRVMFPISDRRGKIIAFGGRVMDGSEPKYLNSPDTELFSKGEILYAASLSSAQAREKKEIIVVEGYMDVIALHAAGIERAVAPLGTALTEHQIQELWKYAPEPILCFDGDKAGQRAAIRAAKRSLPLLKPGYSLRFVTLPDDLDPDEYIKERGKEAFENFLNASCRSLADQLWQQTTANKPIDTPERKAALEKDVRDTLDEIKDPSVKSFYARDFKSKLWELTSPYKPSLKKRSSNVFSKNKYNKKRKNDTFHEHPELSVYHPAVVPEKEEARMMAAYLLAYPEIASEFPEELAQWEIRDASLKSFFDKILEALSDNPDITASELQERLKVEGCEDALRGLSAETEILKRKSARTGEIKEEFCKRLSLPKKKAYEDEIKRIAAEIAVTEDEERARLLWERYKELLQEQQALA